MKFLENKYQNFTQKQKLLRMVEKSSCKKTRFPKNKKTLFSTSSEFLFFSSFSQIPTAEKNNYLLGGGVYK